MKISLFRIHFTIGLHFLFTLVLLIILFALPLLVQAQDESRTPLPADVLAVIPPMLATLIILNNRATEFVKLWLAAPSLPINFDKETQRVIVLGASLVIGLGASLFVPNATSWLPNSFQQNFVAAVLLSTFASSFGGAFAQYILMVLAGVSKWFESAKAVYSTSTTISTPTSDVSPETAKKTLEVASQVVRN